MEYNLEYKKIYDKGRPISDYSYFYFEVVQTFLEKW